MYHDMSGWGWGGGLMMIVGLVLLGFVVYGAVRLAISHERQSTPREMNARGRPARRRAVQPERLASRDGNAQAPVAPHG
jgi:hypothetical protein